MISWVVSPVLGSGVNDEVRVCAAWFVAPRVTVLLVKRPITQLEALFENVLVVLAV